MKTTLVATLLNEQDTIERFLISIASQTILPEEIIIVDGGSTDSTLSIISNFQFPVSSKKTKLLVLERKGNRSVGRNYGIEKASGDIILSTDAGCVLDKHWVECITKPFRSPSVQVVAGYYKAKSDSLFQKCLTPFVLVMPDKIQENQTFLPATRSMAFRKKVWEKIGGFPPQYSHNEDYVFARKIEKENIPITFVKDAIVYWIPRRNIRAAWWMFFRFAMGDGEAGIMRPNVIFLFFRYTLFFQILFLFSRYKSWLLFFIIFFGSIGYIVWAIKKNYRYCNDKRAFFLLPVLQLTADTSVLVGTTVGAIRRVRFFPLRTFTKQYCKEILFLFLYIGMMLSVLSWGIPGNTHPFAYQMDEWHQAQAVRTVAKYGTSNIPGSANGTMFHFLESAVLLAPAVLLHIVNPFAIHSSVDALLMQERLFQLLRLNTLLFGILSYVVLLIISRKYLQSSTTLTSLLFLTSPGWISLSNYFKYDIALIFWILLSLLFAMEFLKLQSKVLFFVSIGITAITFCVKVSALPLLPAILLGYFFFLPKEKKKAKDICIAICLFLLIVAFFGIPDLLFGKGDIREYLYDNLVRTPGMLTNYQIPVSYTWYIASRAIPTVVGHGLYILFLFSLLCLVAFFVQRKKLVAQRELIFLLGAFLLFSLSLLPLKFEARGNRLLVLLPFMVLVVSYVYTRLQEMIKTFFGKGLFLFVIFCLASLQIFEGYSWWVLKLQPDPRQEASSWIAKHIAEHEMLGIENIPLYQYLPDLVLKEFYEKDHDHSRKTKYAYIIIDKNMTILPQKIIITDSYYENTIFLNSPKKDILKKLISANYKKIYEVKPNYGSVLLFNTAFDIKLANIVPMPTSIMIYQRK